MTLEKQRPTVREITPTDIKRIALAEAVRKDPANKEARHAYASYIRDNVIPQMQKEAQPYSFQEYFSFALQEATIALEEGNYAIGAIYILRQKNKKGQVTETVIGGRNRSVSERNTHLHAEEDVLDAAEKILNRGKPTDDSRILTPKDRLAPDEIEKKILFSSLEPCIGCYRRLTTHNPDEVWIATPDVTGGAMLDGRLEQLPGMWATRTQKRGITVITPTDDPTSPYYINPAYTDIALEMFGTTQKYIDETIGGQAEDSRRINKALRRSRRRFPPLRHMF